MSKDDRTKPLSLDLSHPDDEFSLLQRLVVGSGLIYDLHKSGHRCTNIFNKYKCEDCIATVDFYKGELKKELCTAIKLFIKLEREYYLWQICDIILRYSQVERVEKKQPEIQMKLF